jgi:transcription-repair coupling factor (superfamily II helicase)
MGLYRRLNEVEDRQGLEAFAAELIDRFGKLPAPTQNLFKVIEIKQNCVAANIAKIDVGAKGALVSFFEDRFPRPENLVAYIQRLNGVARLRPDSKVVVNRAWADPAARLNGALQLSKGLAKAAG